MWSRCDQVASFLRYLRDEPRCKFACLVDICGVDHPRPAEPLRCCLYLLSLTLNHRIRVKDGDG